MIDFSINHKDPSLSDERFNNSEFAKRYADKHLKMSLNFADKLAVKLFRKEFHKGKVLDSGCGPGFVIIELAKKFAACEFVGIDLSEPLLEIAENNNQKEILTERVKFLKANVQDIPFPDNYFDFAININMLHLVDEPVKMLNEIERVLKPGGFFFITDLRKSILGLLEKEIKSVFAVEEAKKIIEKSNLSKGHFSSSVIWWNYQNI
ncbi:MAG: class I SAM-dependent methyltransferase [Ignavibacteriaceae bacterium]